MPTYDPQRSHRRQPPPEDAPAPVDALLEPHPPASSIPGVDVSMSPDGEEIIVHTDEADIEIRPMQHDVIVSTAEEDLYVELPGADETGPAELRIVASNEIVESPLGTAAGRNAGAGRRLATIVGLLLALLVALALLRRRRGG